eukprot:353770-Chlamydomonas_euryale.AAC.7
MSKHSSKQEWHAGRECITLEHFSKPEWHFGSARALPKCSMAKLLNKPKGARAHPWCCPMGLLQWQRRSEETPKAAAQDIPCFPSTVESVSFR